MAEIRCTTDTLSVTMTGLDRLWALKRQIDVPLAQVERVEHDPSVGFPSLFHIRMPGTYIPGVIAAGTFRQDGQWVFWDVHNPKHAVVIHLRNERYAKLIVEVDDPATTVERVQQALSAVRTDARDGPTV